MYQTLHTCLLRKARCWDADSQNTYQELFDKLDANKDGKVDVAELRTGLAAMGIFRKGAAQVKLCANRFHNYLCVWLSVCVSVNECVSIMTHAFIFTFSH